MAGTSRIITLGAIGVVVFDASASVLSLLLGVDYGWAIIGSGLLYAGVGFAAVRADRSSSGLRAGAVLGLVDATIGWTVSWVIGPGQVPGATLGLIIMAGLIVVATAAVLGAAGAFAARRGHPPAARAV